MHRLLLVLVVGVLLASCTQAPPRPAPPAQVEETPVVVPPKVAAAKVEAYPIAAPPAPAAPELVALLLPTDAPMVAEEAQAVERGFFTAKEMDPTPLAVDVLATGASPEKALEQYRRAVISGAKVVVGPLARSAVGALERLGSFSVPTLVLNLGTLTSPSPNLYYFPGVSVVKEAEDLAGMAFAQGKMSAAIVASDAPLASRTAKALAARWQILGGHVADFETFPVAQESFSQLGERVASSGADVVFLLADGARAARLRPYLPSGVAVYATSQIYSERSPQKNSDLEGVVFVDMPWLLDFNNPTVLTYPRSERALSVERERLYALGIDAYRIAKVLAQGVPSTFELGGVTGQINLMPNHVFDRESVPARFVAGYPRLLDSPSGP